MRHCKNELTEGKDPGLEDSWAEPPLTLYSRSVGNQDFGFGFLAGIGMAQCWISAHACTLLGPSRLADCAGEGPTTPGYSSSCGVSVGATNRSVSMRFKRPSIRVILSFSSVRIALSSWPRKYDVIEAARV